MNIKKIFGFTQEKPVRLEILHTCFVTEGGKSMQVTEGDTVEVSPKVAAQLVSNGQARNPEAIALATATAEHNSRLLPPAPTPEPLPESWEKLPKCFSDWHALDQQGAMLIRRRNAIEKALIDIITPHSLWPDIHTSGINQLRPDQKAELLKAPLSQGISEQDLKNQRFLRDRLQAARELASEWHASNDERLFKLRIDCSDATMEAHSKLSRTARDIASIGFELFALRVAPLGLATYKVNNLYNGSADFVKYEHAAQPGTLQDVRQLWHLDGGKDQRHFIDHQPPTLASMLERFTAQQVTFDKLHKEAAAELTRAKKATLAVA